MASTDPQASHLSRLTFEQRAMAMVIVVLGLALLACFIALWPGAWAKDIGDRITAMRDNIVYFVSLIAANLGISFTRGAASEHIDKQKGAPE